MVRRLEKIWLKRARQGPMDPVLAASAVSDRGLVGNADQGGRRQVTVLSLESWSAAVADLGRTDLDPRLRRANLLIRGIELEKSREGVLLVGNVRLLICGETRPCRAMDEAHPGLQSALAKQWRGGVYGQVLADGEIRVGAPVRWEDS